LHVKIGPYRLEIRAQLTLIFVNGFKEYDAPGDVDVQQSGLPTPRVDLLSLNLKAAAFFDTAQQPEAKVDLVDNMRVDFHQSLPLRLDPDLS